VDKTSIRMRENRDKRRKYVHGVAKIKPWIEQNRMTCDVDFAQRHDQCRQNCPHNALIGWRVLTLL